MRIFFWRSSRISQKRMWATYSMLKSMLMVKEAAEISKYPKLMAFLKEQAVSHQENKVLIREEVHIFM